MERQAKGKQTNGKHEIGQHTEIHRPRGVAGETLREIDLGQPNTELEN